MSVQPKRAALYLRVSTRGQSTDMQRAELLEFAQRRGWELAGVYEDKLSGRKARRPGLDRLREDCRQGKVQLVVVWKVDRLGRSLRDLVSILEEWRTLDVDLVSQQEPQIDTTTPTGRLMLGLVAIFAEWESEMNKERVAAGMKRARDRGVVFGGTPKLTTAQAEAAIEKHGGLRAAARALKVSASTVSRALKRGQ